MTEILSLSPAYKNYIWGGERLKKEYGKQSDDIVAETWELSCNPNGLSIVDSGTYKGMTLKDALDKMGADCLGTSAAAFDFFPVLIKLIDAKNSLSIQVHPNDEYALKNENSYGKTEVWYIVDAVEGAFLYCGFNKDIDKDEFVQRIKDNTLLEVLNKVYVKKGDVVFIDAGTVHAINAGILIAEIQQNSDLTYRIYDYNRLGADGKPRPLHIEKAIAVTDFSKKETVNNNKANDNMLCTCPYFEVYRHNVNGSANLKSTEKSFHCLLCLEGDAKVVSGNQSVVLNKGKCLFIPADTEYTVDGNCEFLLTLIP